MWNLIFTIECILFDDFMVFTDESNSYVQIYVGQMVKCLCGVNQMPTFTQSHGKAWQWENHRGSDMSSVGVGHLHFIDGIKNKYGHLNIWKQNVKQSVDKFANSFAFYQANNPKHTSGVAELW